MKKGITNSATSKNQTTLGQFWSSNGSKPTKPTNKSEIIMQDDDDDDDIELLTAMEQFEKNNSQPPPITATTTTTKTTTNTNTTASTSKWPIAYKPDQNSNQTHRASVSAPANDNEQLHTYPDFDRQSGLIWIYPTNYEKRDYQYKVVSAALFQNTLVVLPTGLGKTFIAAVVMFNYCRWYPTGKIIFTAPTKPLVAQQMDACAKVMGIRKSEMCEMTGGVNPEERRRLWLEKRVFFLTPQTLNNDLVKSTCPWSKIRCLIIDEAHRALGQHAYCQVVQELCKNGEEFRVLALSATPGNNVEAVQNVINNLKISHIEMFTDESPDIKKYSFDKIIDKIVVGPNQLMQELRRCILNILKPPVETLNRLGIFYQKNPEHISSGSVILTMRRVMKDKPQNLNDKQYQEAKGALFFAISFYHALDELEKHGLQSVYNFFKKKLTEDKKNGLLHATFRNNSELNQIYTQLQNLFDLSQVSTQQRRTTSLQVAHPKLSKLRECVVEHFQTFERTKTKANDQTRVIIFSEKRDSVREIAELLEQDQPLVKPMAFIGQASSHAAGQGINQKLQKKVVNDFRAGGYNVLIATSIGEEGLDIGSVDLIICFDALKSPIRLVQRMGRTGRARQGRIVLLMTEGKEERTYYEGEMQQKRIFKLIVDGARMLELYRNNLRMIPHDIQPVCQEMTVKINDDSDVPDKQTNKKFKSNDSDFNSMISKTKQQENLLKLFRKDKLLTDNEFYQWVRNYQVTDDDETPIMSPKDRIKLMIKTANEKWSNEQREIQSQSMCSSRTKIFVDFMKNYSNERVYVDIPDHSWPMDEPVVQEITIPSKPKMPSPFDRSKLKEQIQSKQSCSPIDLAKMPGECDELLNLQPIIHRNENNEEEVEEIDCGDLFGSSNRQTCSPMHLSEMPGEYDEMLNLQPIIDQKENNEEEVEEIDCGDLFGSSNRQTCSPMHLSEMPGEYDEMLNLQPIIDQKENNEEEVEEIDCGDLFGGTSKQTFTPIRSSKIPEKFDQSLNLHPVIHQKENEEEEEIDCGDLFGSTSKQTRTPIHSSKMPGKFDQSLNLQPIVHQKEEEEIDCGDLFGSSSKQTFTPIRSSKIPEKFDQSLNLHPVIHQKENEEEEEIDCGDLFGSTSKQTCTPIHSSKTPGKSDRPLNLQPVIHQKENEDDEIDCGDLFGSSSKKTFTPIHSSKTPGKCDKSLTLQPIIHKKENEDDEIDCGDLFGTGSTFDITCSHDEPIHPTTSSPTQTRPIQDGDIGNFNVTMVDLFAASQASHLSPTLQITDIKSQQKNLFDDDDNGMNDDELLEAFNKHIESSSESIQITNPSPILILSNRVNTQIPIADVTAPKFDLEFNFDDLDNSDEFNNNNNNNNNIQPISISESTNKHNITTCSDKFETPIRPVPSKKRARLISTVTPDIIGRKKCKSAQELGDQEQRHFHRRLASEFFDDEAIVDDTLSDTISSDEDDNDHSNEHDHFIDDRQVLTQMANIDMKSVYLKSIKSPKIQFRPPPPSIPIEDIYSQLPHMTMHDDTYDEDDSFVDDTTQVIDDHHGEVDFDELANILGTQSVIHRQSKVTRRGVKFGPRSATPTPRRKPQRRVQIAQSPS